MGYLWFRLGHFPATSWDCEDRHDCLRTQKTFLWEMTQSIPQLSVAFRCFLDCRSLDPGSRRRNLLLRCLQCGAGFFAWCYRDITWRLGWFEEEHHNWHILQHEMLRYLGYTFGASGTFWQVLLSNIFYLACLVSCKMRQYLQPCAHLDGRLADPWCKNVEIDGRDVRICAHDSTNTFLEWWSGLGRNRRSKRHQDAYQDTWHVGLCGRHAWIRLQKNGSSFWHLIYPCHRCSNKDTCASLAAALRRQQKVSFTIWPYHKTQDPPKPHQTYPVW